MQQALQQAEQLFAVPADYLAVQRQGMQQNFSWQAAVTEYIHVYQQALN